MSYVDTASKLFIPSWENPLQPTRSLVVIGATFNLFSSLFHQLVASQQGSSEIPCEINLLSLDPNFSCIFTHVSDYFFKPVYHTIEQTISGAFIGARVGIAATTMYAIYESRVLLASILTGNPPYFN